MEKITKMKRRTFLKLSGATAGTVLVGSMGLGTPCEGSVSSHATCSRERVVESAKNTEVLYNADVVVIGAGPSGIGAALGAARNGANTVLIEKFNCAGGLQTQSCNPVFTRIHPELQGGIVTEIIANLADAGVMTPRPFPRAGGPDPTELMEGFYRWFGSDFFNQEYYKYMLDNMFEEAGVKVIYNAQAADVIRKRDKIKGIIIESHEGRHAVLGKVFIDCTGKGDIVNKSGASALIDLMGVTGVTGGWSMGAYFFGNVDLESFQPWYFYMLATNQFPSDLGISFGNADVPNRWRILTTITLPESKESLTVEGLSDLDIAFRRKAMMQFQYFKANAPGMEGAFLELTPNLQCTKAYKIEGEHIFSLEDMREVRAFDDAIAVVNWPPDVWDPAGPRNFMYDTMPYDVPFMSLVSKDIDNLMAAGNLISSNGAPGASLNYCVPSMCTGQAAGTAAALAVNYGITKMKNMDIYRLQNTLRSQGVVVTIEDVPDDVMALYSEVIEKYSEIRGDS